MRRDYGGYLQDMIDSVNDVEAFTRGMAFGDFTKDRKTVNAVVRSIEVIGGATKNIPKSIRDKYPLLPWKKMAGMRDRMIHEYFAVDLEILWKVVNDELPPLKPLLQDVLKDLDERHD